MLGILQPSLIVCGSRTQARSFSAVLGTVPAPNDAAQLAAWVAHTQQLKPGARMPSSGERIADADLQSIAAWLTQLK